MTLQVLDLNLLSFKDIHTTKRLYVEIPQILTTNTLTRIK